MNIWSFSYLSVQFLRTWSNFNNTLLSVSVQISYQIWADLDGGPYVEPPWHVGQREEPACPTLKVDLKLEKSCSLLCWWNIHTHKKVENTVNFKAILNNVSTIRKLKSISQIKAECVFFQNMCSNLNNFISKLLYFHFFWRQVLAEMTDF